MYVLCVSNPAVAAKSNKPLLTTLIETNVLPLQQTSVIFVNENENGEKRENNEFVNKN